MTTHSIVLAAIDITTSRRLEITGTPRVAEIAALTGLPIASTSEIESADFYLFWRDQHLTLRDQSTKNTVDISVDFCSGKNKHRLQFGGGYGQPLARAIDAKPGRKQLVCDATGGLGHDAFVFASLGCEVVILERSRIVFALLYDALQRARSDQHISEIAKRMAVYQLDSTDLPACWPLSSPPVCVYLDPMYPHSKKTAAARKGMQTLQRLLAVEKPVSADNSTQHNEAGETHNNEEFMLLSSALKTATRRVTVKRPAKALPIGGVDPVGSIKSPNTRFDLYNAQK